MEETFTLQLTRAEAETLLGGIRTVLSECSYGDPHELEEERAMESRLCALLGIPAHYAD